MENEVAYSARLWLLLLARKWMFTLCVVYSICPAVHQVQCAYAVVDKSPRKPFAASADAAAAVEHQKL